MKNEGRFVLTAIAFLAVLSVGLLSLIQALATLKDKPAVGDLATWFGAFGTFTAFVGAFLLATRDQREKKREAEQWAVIVFRTLTEPFGFNRGMILAAADIYKNPVPLPGQTYNHAILKSYLSSVNIVSKSDLKDLMQLGRNISADIADMQTQTEMAKKLLTGLIENGPFPPEHYQSLDMMIKRCIASAQIQIEKILMSEHLYDKS